MEKRPVSPKFTGGPRSRLENKQDRVLRQKAMLTQKILGMSVKEIAKHFQVNTGVVRGELELARRDNVLGAADQAIVEALVPAAVMVMAKHLEENNYEAAKDVLYGMGVLKKNGLSGLKTDDREITLELVRAKISAKKTPKEGTEETSGDVVDGQVVGEEDQKVLSEGVSKGEVDATEG